MEDNINQLNQTLNSPENNQIGQSQSKVRPIIVVSLILLLLLVSAGSFVLGKYFNSFQEQPEITQTLKPNKTTTPSPITDSTANWKTYTNNNIGFEFKYPPKWLIEENNRNTEGNIIIDPINIDNGYKQGLDIPPGLITIYYANVFREPLGYNDNNLMINFDIGINNKIPAKKYQVNTKNFSSNPVYNNKDLLIYYIDKSRYNEQKGGIEIHFTYDKNKQYNTEFDQILSTFRFLDNTTTTSTENWKTYTSTKNKYFFLYPNAWFITDKTLHTGGDNLDIAIKSGQKDELVVLVQPEGFGSSPGESTNNQPIKVGLLNGTENISEDLITVRVKKENIWYLISYKFDISRKVESISVLNQILSTFKFLE